jgi:hypothetical protein
MAADAAKGRSTLALLAALTAPLALGACVAVETTAELAPDAAASNQFALRAGANFAQASVAIVSVDGAPPAIAAGFERRLDSDARARELAVVDAGKARYLVRGYLSASPTEDGAEIEYVWDVFTAQKQRVQRLNDVIEVKGAGGDPWTLAGEAALTSVAAKSADDLAAFLSNTPEAAPAAAAAEPPPAETALGYASLR